MRISPGGIVWFLDRRSDELLSDGRDPVASTLEALSETLQPFMQAGWLTKVVPGGPGGQLIQSALTIVITGVDGPPPGLIIDPPNSTRYMFLDAPLEELNNPVYTPSLSPMASATFSSLVGSSWVIPKLAKKKLLRYITTAHQKGIAVRVTEPIDFPVWIRCVVA